MSHWIKVIAELCAQYCTGGTAECCQNPYSLYHIRTQEPGVCCRH